MDETPTEKPAEGGLNKIDLTQLQGFSFGTQWSDSGNRNSASTGSSNRDHQRRDDRPRREGGPAEPRRDRRSFRKPAADAAHDAGQSADARASESGAHGERPPRQRREFRGGGRDSEGSAHHQGGHGHGPRRDFRGGGPRREGTGAPIDRGPYINPNFNLTLYTEDAGFSALAKAVRASCRTYELFDIARVIVEKNDRFIAVIQRKAPEPSRAPAASATGSAEGATPVSVTQTHVKPAPFYISVPDGIPFDTEEAAIQHILTHHLGLFFQTTEAEIEAPKGNFQVINRCTVTGKLLAPPNYHRYTQIVQQHHAANIRMPFETYRSKIESVRDPELINQWLEAMKKITRYVWTPPVSKARQAAAAKAAAAAAAKAQAAAESELTNAVPAVEADTAQTAPSNAETTVPETVAPANETQQPVSEPAVPVAAEPVAAETAANADHPPPPPPPPAEEETPAKPIITFDSLEDARAYLLAHARDRIIRATNQIRYPGRLLDKLPPGEIRRSIEGYLEKQRRFPLDTANALRGRLRREGFTIFKKGSKGVSYVCAVKRKFRIPGQVFADSIDALIRHIEAHPMVRQIDLPEKFLGITFPAPAAKTPENADAGTQAASSPLATLSPEDQARLNRMQMDLRWLVGEGYVTEFRDGRLFAPAPMVEARKKEIEGAEHDPENFPDVPSTNTTPATPSEATPPVETAAEETTEPASSAAENVSETDDVPASETTPSENESESNKT